MTSKSKIKRVTEPDSEKILRVEGSTLAFGTNTSVESTKEALDLDQSARKIVEELLQNENSVISQPTNLAPAPQKTLTEELNNLINIRNYLASAPEYSTINKDAINDLIHLRSFVDRKLVDLLLSEEFKQFVNFKPKAVPTPPTKSGIV